MQKPPYFIPNIIKKIKSSSRFVHLKNLNHFRDFLNTKDIILAIDVLMKNKMTGIFNIGSGLKFDLRNVAEIFSKKYNKNIRFKNSKESSFLISDNKKICKLKWKPIKFNNKIDYFYK